MTIVFGLCGVLVFTYTVFCIGLRQWQTRLLFFPDAQLQILPESIGLAAKKIWLPVGQGEHQGFVNGWWIPAKEDANQQRDAPVVLYLHGNGSNLGDLTETGQRFHDLGWHCLLIDYRGYGLSQGSFPAEERVYEDAEVAWIYLVETLGIEPTRIIVYGHSLGGAIAIELATRQPQMAGLIVEGSFTSMLDMAELQPRYKVFPLNWILTQRFESLDKVRSLQPSLLLLHGTADETIPYQMSQRLHETAKRSIHQPHTQIVLIPRAGHNDLPEVGGERYLQVMRDFVEQVTHSEVAPSSL
ncbi:MAG: alpha/beta hydrolase [Moorea sp. SIO3C2]|nr:alpha/beta hydrolase [Moorena sp. SIO3C2]